MNAKVECSSTVCSGSNFMTEAKLVDAFVQTLLSGRSCWRSVEIATEWSYSAGFADVLARNSKRELIAFEAKLENWRSAFHQAYRNCAYANRAYVLMPYETVHRALKHREDFEFRGIGLCSYRDGKVFVHIKASRQDELLAWERRRAHAHFDGKIDERRKANRSCSRLLFSKRVSVCT